MTKSAKAKPPLSASVLTIKKWHKRIPSEAATYIRAIGLHFEVRGRNVVIAGHTSTNCDVEIELEGDVLMDLMRAFVASKLAKVED